MARSATAIKRSCPQARAIRERIGYPDEILTDDNKLNSEYQEVSVHSGRWDQQRGWREKALNWPSWPS